MFIIHVDLEEVPFGFYFSLIAALVVQAIPKVVRCVRYTLASCATTIQIVSSLSYAEYATTGALIAHQVFNRGRMIGSWILFHLDSAKQVIYITSDPSTAQMAVFVIYAAVGLSCMILRSVCDVLYWLWLVILFFVYHAIYVVRIIASFGFHRQPRHPSIVVPAASRWSSIDDIAINCPSEILIQILRYLTWTACHEFKAAVAASINHESAEMRKINHAIAERWNPAVYLSQHFRDGQNRGAGISLLQTMTNCGMILSGSRALEYFLGGLADESSDWDFYVPAVGRNVYMAIKGLEDVGVVFQTTLDRVKRKMEARKANIVLTFPDLVALQIERAEHSDDQVVQRLLPHETLREMMDWMVHQRYARLQLVGEEYVLKEEPDRTFHSDDRGHDTDSYDRGMVIIHGVTKGNVDHDIAPTKVQLIVDHRGSFWREGDVNVLEGASSVYSSILRFHSSVVQCFLTGFAAAHLYHTSLDDNKAIAWDLAQESAIVQSTSRQAIVKYTARGIVYNDDERRGRWYRRLGDNADALVIRFHDLGLPRNDTLRVSWEYRVMADLSWVESAKQISRLVGPDQQAVAKVIKKLGSEANTLPPNVRNFWRPLRVDSLETSDDVWDHISPEPISKRELEAMVHFTAKYSAAYSSLYNGADATDFRKGMLMQAMRFGTAFPYRNCWPGILGEE